MDEWTEVYGEEGTCAGTARVRPVRRVPVPVPLLLAMRGRVRHDHSYPFEISTPERPHRCPGCEIEEKLDCEEQEARFSVDDEERRVTWHLCADCVARR